MREGGTEGERERKEREKREKREICLVIGFTNLMTSTTIFNQTRCFQSIHPVYIPTHHHNITLTHPHTLIATHLL